MIGADGAIGTFRPPASRRASPASLVCEEWDPPHCGNTGPAALRERSRGTAVRRFPGGLGGVGSCLRRRAALLFQATGPTPLSRPPFSAGNQKTGC